jgi:hypothetical protein
MGQSAPPSGHPQIAQFSRVATSPEYRICSHRAGVPTSVAKLAHAQPFTIDHRHARARRAGSRNSSGMTLGDLETAFWNAHTKLAFLGSCA